MSMESGSEVSFSQSSGVEPTSGTAPESFSTVVMVESTGTPGRSPLQNTAAARSHVRVQSVPDAINIHASRRSQQSRPGFDSSGTVSQSWKANSILQQPIQVTLVKSDSTDAGLQIRVVGTPERKESTEPRGTPLKTDEARKAALRSSLLKRDSSVDFKEEWAASAKLSQQKQLGKWRDPVTASSPEMKEAWVDGFDSPSEKSASPVGQPPVSFGGRPIQASQELVDLIDSEHDSEEMPVMRVGAQSNLDTDAQEKKMRSGHSWLKSTDFVHGSTQVGSRVHRTPSFEDV
ncbi:hypothetical protein FVE85_2052 [Porphyridium purpureum]|uniref:Uncharacterized protein n=1 Tax=Porphyridium purpureum TaxID=35688 RepID=A0A5J4YZN2_PORPP|nr:hypothetical protein FVE85_2052 [Porphyridium purpureum]|eukprot:POR4447..scf209_3